MLPNTTTRSNTTEIMDDFDMTGGMLRDTLKKLDWINKLLGGNQVTMSAVKELLVNFPKEKTLRIVDVGCGSGDMLRRVARWLRRRGQAAHLIGIDANAFIVDYAREHSTEYPEIEYLSTFVPSEAFLDLKYDVLLSTLFLHHLNDKEADHLLQIATQQAQTGIIINDLHRSPMAYFLFNLVTLAVPNPMIRQDGLTSILRGFKRNELQHFAKHLKDTQSTIRWRWAFRYQWIIRTKK